MISKGYFSASLIAVSVLPEAVGPIKKLQEIGIYMSFNESIISS